MFGGFQEIEDEHQSLLVLDLGGALFWTLCAFHVELAEWTHLFIGRYAPVTLVIRFFYAVRFYKELSKNNRFRELLPRGERLTR